MKLIKNFKLKGIEPRYPITQGGMGAGISLFKLVSEVGRRGCIGTVSSAALDQFTPRRLGIGNRMNPIEAAEREIYDTKQIGGIVAINIMVALVSSYENSVEGAIRGGVDIISSGAGMPMNLPSLADKYAGKGHKINLIPIISSARAFTLVCKRWERQGYRPDAVVVEGPKAGGHLGFNYDQVKKSGSKFLEDYDLFRILTQPGIDDTKNEYGSVLDVAAKYPNDFGPIPIIAAGGIFTNKDINYFMYHGAAGVQIGTRFLATHESGASDEFKQAVVDVKKNEIVIADANWGSSCGLPFRYMTISPLRQAFERLSLSEQEQYKFFCICTTLLGSAGIEKEYDDNIECPEAYARRGKKCPGAGCASNKGLFTCGTEAYRVNKIMSVEELVDELIG